ncbi:alpha-ketoglutarate-dependent dioxygenase AlkB family protein [Pirellulaceae bacterium SH501]
MGSIDMGSMQTIELADGGVLLYQEQFIEPGMADVYFEALQTRCQWEQKPGVFGYMQPRLIASYGDDGLSYRYSGRDYAALPWFSELLELKKRVESVLGTYNYCLLNRYRNGSDSMGWHADDEPEMGETIGSLSLGATRKFRIRHNGTRETQTFLAGHGTLIVMSGTMQRYWQHEVPKTKKPVGERINLTFRQVLQVEKRR